MFSTAFLSFRKDQWDKTLGKRFGRQFHCFGTWRDVKSTTRSSLGVRRCNSHMFALPMLVNIHFRKYYICNKNKWWLTNQTSWTTWCNFTPRSRARSTTATATKTSLKKWFRADSNLIALIFPPWYSSSNVSKFLWSRILDWLYLSSGKKKAFFTSSTKRENRHFHVVIVCWRQRNVQKRVLLLNLMLFWGPSEGFQIWCLEKWIFTSIEGYWLVSTAYEFLVLPGTTQYYPPLDR